ncbi:MAG: hypothetical protein ACRDQA_22600 [Nocardioidaceae bacterium]
MPGGRTEYATGGRGAELDTAVARIRTHLAEPDAPGVYDSKAVAGPSR